MKQTYKYFLSAALASVITGVLFSLLDYLISRPVRPIQQYLVLDLAWIAVWVAAYLLINRFVQKRER